MNDIYLGAAIFLLLNVLVGMARIIRGPMPADRMLASQLFGTTGVAIALLLAEVYERPAIRTVGLVFAVLAVIATAVFVRRDAAAPSTGEPA
jgi:multicomponent Na+:H+ antiporter subunit F